MDRSRHYDVDAAAAEEVYVCCVPSLSLRPRILRAARTTVIRSANRGNVALPGAAGNRGRDTFKPSLATRHPLQADARSRPRPPGTTRSADFLSTWTYYFRHSRWW